MVYVVKRGDTMRKIAEGHNSSVAEFLAANPGVVDADRIFVGQELAIPAAAPAAGKKPAAKKRVAKKPAAKKPAAKKPAAKKPAAKKPAATYEVQSGDSMKRIAARFGVTLTDLIGANPDIPNPDVIRLGQTLVIPSAGAGKPVQDGVSSQETGKKQSSPRRPAPTRKRNWTKEPVEKRVLHVMERLIAYGYPTNGAAGILGNVFVESGVLPNRIQGSRPDAPMRSLGFDRVLTDFTPEDVMNRNDERRRGPLLAGIGLAQWTSESRRARLFAHKYRGKVLKGDILFDLDAQVDYLVTELRGTYARVDRVVHDQAVSVDAAADEVLYEFEVPASVIGTDGKLPRSNAAVRKVFGIRRAEAHRAHDLYRSAHGA